MARNARTPLIALLSISAYFYGNFQYKFPDLSEEGISGNARFTIESVTTKRSFFGRSWVYQGTLQSFITENSIAKDSPSKLAVNIPCKIILPFAGTIDPPKANADYLIEGRLKKDPNGSYRLVVKKETPWTPLKSTWSPAQHRYQIKQAVGYWIRTHITDPNAATFLVGIATGNFDDRLMSHAFGRFGLQHIMAISGFHFSIIAGILGLALRFFFSEKMSSLFLVLLLSSYFLFLGGSPSVLRAWVTILIAIAGVLLGKRPSGLNSLGIAMIAVLILNPLACQNMGFQLSFLATAAILMFYQTAMDLIERCFKKRSLQEMILMNSKNQHGYYILNFFKQATALGLAVNIVTIPVVLLYFHKFPLLSLFYNLFFPFMVSISMLLLILAAIFSFLLTFIGDIFHNLNNFYTPFMLNFTYNLPLSLDVVYHTKDVPVWFIVIFISTTFTAGIVYAHRKEESIKFAF